MLHCHTCASPMHGVSNPILRLRRVRSHSASDVLYPRMFAGPNTRRTAKVYVRMATERLAYHRAEHRRARVPGSKPPALDLSKVVVIAVNYPRRLPHRTMTGIVHPIVACDRNPLSLINGVEEQVFT